MNLHKAAIVIENYPQWKKNGFFLNEPYFGYRSDVQHFAVLKRKLESVGIILNTHDVENIEDCKIIICFDQAEANLPTIDGQVKYLIIHDTFIYNAANWNIINHVNFDKIFVWNEDVVDSKKYFHYNVPINLDFTPPQLVTMQTYEERMLCVMVSGEGTVNKNNSRYSLAFERYKIVHWFANNAPKDFRIFGRGWKDKLFRFRGYSKLDLFLPDKLLVKLGKWYSNKNILTKIYGGEIGPLDKLNIISKFNFYICYENSSINGWITEKIFDCFYASCVPVYLGAENICNYIPANCFINRNDFASNEELYEYLKSMTYKTYNNYLENISAFLNSEQLDKFSLETFADNILVHITNDLKLK